MSIVSIKLKLLDNIVLKVDNNEEVPLILLIKGKKKKKANIYLILALSIEEEYYN